MENFEHGQAETVKKRHIISRERGMISLRLTFEEIREKEVVNIADGSCFGYADDIAVDTETKKVAAIIIKGRHRFFGLFGREEDVSIDWEEIDTIGRDIILVKTAKKGKLHNDRGNILEKILDIFF